MTITIKSKDVGDVQDKFIEGNIVRGLEDFNEDYIKLDLGVGE